MERSGPLIPLTLTGLQARALARAAGTSSAGLLLRRALGNARRRDTIVFYLPAADAKALLEKAERQAAHPHETIALFEGLRSWIIALYKALIQLRESIRREALST